MTTHHTSLYDDKTNPAPNGVLKQELVTLEQTPDGIRITRLKRRFSGEAVNSSFESEPISLTEAKQASLCAGLILWQSKLIFYWEFEDVYQGCFYYCAI